MKFARIADGSVQEIIEVTDLDDLKTRFTLDSVKEWVEATDSIKPNMTWDGSNFGAEAPRNVETDEQKAADEKFTNEWNAKSKEEKWTYNLQFVPEYIKADAAQLEKDKTAYMAMLDKEAE